eukprot:TRINITY_DN11875_c0_g1_i4.p1 TRINITY_DN11875_c0_g1~~TRINITY_DN11875_c0_g1_i4.p1  ORF type:complete len:401 (-),score=60.56 TRINITY_DN11875_c0_g1_i4:130-1332(-)
MSLGDHFGKSPRAKFIVSPVCSSPTPSCFTPRASRPLSAPGPLRSSTARRRAEAKDCPCPKKPPVPRRPQTANVRRFRVRRASAPMIRVRPESIVEDWNQAQVQTISEERALARQNNHAKTTTASSPRIVLAGDGRPRVRLFSRDSLKLFATGGCSRSVIRRVQGCTLSDSVRISASAAESCPYSVSAIAPLWLFKDYDPEPLSYLRELWSKYSVRKSDELPFQQFRAVLIELGCAAGPDLSKRLFAVCVGLAGERENNINSKYKKTRRSLGMTDFLEGIKALLFVPLETPERIKALYTFFDEDKHGFVEPADVRITQKYANTSEQQTEALIDKVWNSPFLKAVEVNWVITAAHERRLSFHGFVHAVELFPELVQLFEKKHKGGAPTRFAPDSELSLIHI